MNLFFDGFLLGLSTGIFCLTWCGPVFISLILSEKKNIKQSILLFLEFIAGRLIGYVLFGAIFGYLGSKFQNTIVQKINLGALMLLSSLLILYGLGLFKEKHNLCRFFKKIRFPILAGFLTGVNLCPSFLLSLSYVFNAGEIIKGVLFFVSFFIATTLYLVPLLFLSYLNIGRAFQKIAKLASILVGGLFLIYGLSVWLGYSPQSCFDCPFFKMEQMPGLVPLVIFCLLILTAVIFFLNDKYPWLRNFTLLFSLFYFGFWLKNIFCPLKTFQIMFIDGGKIAANLVLFLFFLLPIILALLWGRIYCLWLCPLGAFQEFINKGKNTLKCKCLKNIYFKSKTAGKIKYLILATVVTLLLILRKPILCGLDPFGALFGRFVTAGSIIFLAALVISSLFIWRPWCQFFCPYGAILDLLSKISLFKKKSEKGNEPKK